jgi:uncharacterized paraquat-inducible protein A
MQIQCENCGTTIPGPNINIQEKLAVCPQCGSVFSFADHLARPTPARKFKPPKSLSITEKNNTLHIQYRWMKLLKADEHWFTVVVGMGIVMLGALAVEMFDGLNSILEGIVGGAAAIGALVCLYMFLMVLLNTVSVTIDDRLIRTRHKPLPMDNKTIKRTDIVGVNCAAAWYSKDDPDDELADYNVQLIHHNGHKHTLVTLRRDVAFYIAQVIEDYLHGEELPVDADDESGDEGESLMQQQADEETYLPLARRSEGQK